MIQMQTKLDVADNTGAKLVQCIHVLGGSGRAFAHLGDVIVCSNEVSSTANVVLVPRGYGWPRLGRQNGYGDLCGDAGEPCRLDRWSVAGNILFIHRRASTGVWHQVCLGEALESPVEQGACSWDKPIHVSSRFPVLGWPKKVRGPERQLSLFTRSGLAA